MRAQLIMAQALDKVQSHFLRALSAKYELQIRIEVLKLLEQRIRNGEKLVRLNAMALLLSLSADVRLSRI